MKKLKKVMAVLLAGVMTMAMAVTASATPETGNGSIQITGTKAKGNVEAYRMFSAVVEQNGTSSDKDSVKYTLEPGFEEFFKKTYPDKMNSLSGPALSDAAAEKLDQIQRGTATEKVNFSKQVLAWVLDGTNAAKVADLKYTQAAEEGSTTISNLPFGFYMVYTPEARQEATSETERTPAMMVTVKDTTPVQVNLKSEYPTVDKKVDGNKPASDYKVGDTVTYTLTAKVPDMTGFSAYTFNFVDTMSKGLTFNGITSVTVGGAPISEGTVETNNTYTLTQKKDVPEAGKTKITIAMNKFYDSYKDKVGQDIVVTYTATVNEKAVVGMNPNTNEAKVEFGNNPDKLTDSETSTADVHTFDFSIHKFYKDATGKHDLAGAEFELYEDEQCQNKISLKKLEGKEDTWVPGTPEVTIVTPATGKVTVQGLKAGTYYLKETKAPEGYHLLKQPIKVVIAASYAAETNKLEKYTITYTYEGTELPSVENNSQPLEVENKNGTILPNTGGMGTVLFTVIGIVLILCVAGSFVMSRRKEEN